VTGNLKLHKSHEDGVACQRRAAEKTTATDVLISFGARAIWHVQDTARTEKIIHGALAEYRTRPDREFFNLEFVGACKQMDLLVNELEIAAGVAPP